MGWVQIEDDGVGVVVKVKNLTNPQVIAMLSTILHLHIAKSYGTGCTHNAVEPDDLPPKEKRSKPKKTAKKVRGCAR